MTREDIERCFSYHEASAAMKYYEQEQERLGEIEGDDVVNAFEAGAEWAQGFMIDKAVKWLVTNASDYAISTTGDDDDCIVSLDMVEDFRKAMEE